METNSELPVCTYDEDIGEEKENHDEVYNNKNNSVESSLNIDNANAESFDYTNCSRIFHEITNKQNHKI